MCRLVIRLLCGFGLKWVLMYNLVVIVISSRFSMNIGICYVRLCIFGSSYSLNCVLGLISIMFSIVFSFGFCWIGYYSSRISVLIILVVILNDSGVCSVMFCDSIFYGVMLMVVWIIIVVLMLYRNRFSSSWVRWRGRDVGMVCLLERFLNVGLVGMC